MPGLVFFFSKDFRPTKPPASSSSGTISFGGGNNYQIILMARVFPSGLIRRSEASEVKTP